MAPKESVSHDIPLVACRVVKLSGAHISGPEAQLEPRLAAASPLTLQFPTLNCCPVARMAVFNTHRYH
jgi:hypothetical protein